MMFIKNRARIHFFCNATYTHYEYPEGSILLKCNFVQIKYINFIKVNQNLSSRTHSLLFSLLCIPISG